MSLDALLNMSGDVYSASSAQAANAGAIRSAAAKATGLTCRVQDASANQRMVALSLGLVVTHEILTRYGGTVNGDEWRVGGAVYRVVGVKKRTAIGGMPTFYVIDAAEVRN